MALNWVMITSDGLNPVPLPGEKIFFSQAKVSLILDCGGGYPGNPGTYQANGTLFLTNQRIIFISIPSLPHFKSLSVPILNLKEGKLQQPWFAANYYQGHVMPVHGGGLTVPGQLKITFKEGGGFEFSTMYNEALQRMLEADGTAPPEHLDPLPVYSPPAERASTSNATSAPGAAQGRSSQVSTPPSAPVTERPNQPAINTGELPPSYDEIHQ